MESATMTFQIDGRTRELEFSEDLPFNRLMETIKRSVDDPSLSITRIKLNGEDITGKSWDRFAHFTLGDIKDLQVETGDIRQIARKTLNSLKDFTTNLVAELKRTAELFRLGDEVQGSEALDRTLDGIQLVNHTSIIIDKNLDLEARSPVDNGQTLTAQMINLESIIEDLFAAQKDQDWILMADLIDYELVPHFNDRNNLFRGWEERTDA
ncbi:MAG TPA: hypothetical protein ENL08_04055 [Bacteroidetes bacterium]|nr:hypothetical protein [Bacteroidota bacterium]